nr:Hint domain-containing protein [Sulfitobacter albidus]
MARGALRPNAPLRDMTVSPQHRFLREGAKIELNLGMDEALIAATHLTCLDGVETAPDDSATYIHLMFDAHEIVMSDGCWTESFQPGARSLSGLDEGPRAELETLFPELFDGTADYPAARPTLRRFEAAIALADLTPPAQSALSLAA